MKKKSQKKLLEDYKNALEAIRGIWEKPECLHSCRWGNKTIKICNETLNLKEKDNNASR